MASIDEVEYTITDKMLNQASQGLYSDQQKSEMQGTTYRFSGDYAEDVLNEIYAAIENYDTDDPSSVDELLSALLKYYLVC